MLLLRIAILAVLSAIFLQDLKSRSVQWFWFPLAAVFLAIDQWQEGIPLKEIFIHAALDGAFLFIQLLLLTIYYSVKQKKRIDLTTAGLLGWGDILLLVSIGFYLSPFNYIFFYLGSLLASLSLWPLYQLAAAKKNKQIPLAGLQAMFFIVLLACYWCLGSIDLHQDTWLLYFIT